MNCQEQALRFDCDGESLIGVLSTPPSEVQGTGTAVVVIVGGPQYRAGSHRQFVRLARALAAAGHSVLRYDYRGMGDSSGPARNFEEVSRDVGCAIDALHRHAPASRKTVLFGLCDGASAALLYLNDSADRRVQGMCLLNPWARSGATLARTHLKHYYLQRLASREFWAKLLRGGVGLERIAELTQSLWRGYGTAKAAAAQASFQDRMAQAWRGYEHPVMLALSGNDLTAQEFFEYAGTSPAWSGLLQRAQVSRVDLPDADHTLSDPCSQTRFEKSMLGWLATLRPTH